MPVQKCTKNGESGYRFGKSGTCYTGPNAKQKAIEQGKAIKSQQSKSKGLVRKIFDIIENKE